MTRRVTILAAAVDVALLGFFLAVNSPMLAWLNVVSIVMYVTAYVLITRRKNIAALVLIWTEVLTQPPSEPCWSAGTAGSTTTC